ncbi:hypothetical protein D3C84_575330 [compost metagenome]
MLVVDGAAPVLQRLGAVQGHQIGDGAPVLIALGQAAAQVLLVRQARRPHVGGHVLLVLLEFLAQPLAVDEQIVVQASTGLIHHGAHIAAGIFIVKHQLIEAGLKLLGQHGPVGAHRFEPLEHQLLTPLLPLAADQAGIALLAPLLQPADGGHQEAAVVGLVFDLEITGQIELAPDQRRPVVVDHGGQLAACLFGLLRAGLPVQVNEGGVGVAIDHLEPLRLYPLPGLLHDAVTAQSDR